ncbi:hypothetical protein ABIE69_000988 [Rhodobacteraceae bacterium MBR-64]|jgi:hypothetical protein
MAEGGARTAFFRSVRLLGLAGDIAIEVPALGEAAN